MLLLFLGTAIAWYADAPAALQDGLRWGAEILLLIHAIRKRSITVWIAAAMILGGEFGYLLPQAGAALKVTGKIFIQLIKTIIAPLLFATLVVGIAGHSEIRQVGRLGWKSLLYFEVITTAALFIGLAAINLSGAGKGIPMPVFAKGAETIEAERIAVESRTDRQLVFKVDGKQRDVNPKPNPEKQNWEKILLHTFPENIQAEAQALHQNREQIFKDALADPKRRDVRAS